MTKLNKIKVLRASGRSRKLRLEILYGIKKKSPYFDGFEPGLRPFEETVKKIVFPNIELKIGEPLGSVSNPHLKLTTK